MYPKNIFLKKIEKHFFYANHITYFIFKIKNVQAKKLWNKNVIILVHGLKNVKYFTQNPVTDNRQNNRRL